MNALTDISRDPANKLQHVEESLAEIRQALLSLEYGSISITVHQSRVVQIDVTERKRLKGS